MAHQEKLLTLAIRKTNKTSTLARLKAIELVKSKKKLHKYK
jgi:hypothetical protein